jgi:hypothetical protein
MGHWTPLTKMSSVQFWVFFAFSVGLCIADDVTDDHSSYKLEQPLIYEGMGSTQFTTKLREQITGKTGDFTEFSSADQVAANRWLCQAANAEQDGDLTRPSCKNRPEVYQFKSAEDLNHLTSYAEAMRSVFKQPQLSIFESNRGPIQLIQANFSNPVASLASDKVAPNRSRDLSELQIC